LLSLECATRGRNSSYTSLSNKVLTVESCTSLLGRE
jgi:hypothetical protein